jgi:hypothetical protein
MWGAQLTLNGARLEAELILFSDASHRPVAEFAGSPSDAAVAVAITAGRGARDVDVGSGNLQLDIRDEELAFSTLLQDGDFLLLDDRSNSGW